MKTILICPEHRPAGSLFQRMAPLALMPVLGEPLLCCVLRQLASEGATEVTVLAADRPELIREAVGDGSIWGLTIDVIPTRKEPSIEEARLYAAEGVPCQVRMVDTMPGTSEPLWQAQADTFQKLIRGISRPELAARLTMREVQPGVWVSSQADISRGVTFRAPVWIGPKVRIGQDAVVGPGVVMESHAYVDAHATLEDCWVGPSTYLGAAVNIQASIIWGRLISDLKDAAMLQVDDAFVLDDLSERRRLANAAVPWWEKLCAFLLLLATAPFAGGAALTCWLRKSPVVKSRRVLSPSPGRATVLPRSFKVLELQSRHGWLRRWPELWHVLRGELALVGNRPLTLSEASALRGEMGQLWLAVPAGVFSLADSECEGPVSLAEAVAHAAYFAAHRTLSLRLQILWRCLLRLFTPTAAHPFEDHHRIQQSHAH